MKHGKERVASEEELAERNPQRGTSEGSWPRWNEMQPTDLREHVHRGSQRREMSINPHCAMERSWEYGRGKDGVSRQKSQEWAAIGEKGKAKESRGHEWGKQIHEGGPSSSFYTTAKTSEQGSWPRWNEMQPTDLREQAHRGSERRQMRRIPHCAAERFWEYTRGRDGVSRQKSPEWAAVEEKAKAKESTGQGSRKQIHDGGSSSCFYRAAETSKHGSWPRWNVMQPTDLREQLHIGSERPQMRIHPRCAANRSCEYKRRRDEVSRKKSQEWAAIRDNENAKESRAHEWEKQIHEGGSSSFYTAAKTLEQVPLAAYVQPSGESSVCPTTHLFMNPTTQPKVKLLFPPTLPSESVNLKHKEDHYDFIWEIIDKRWDRQMHKPLHAAALYLNPGLYYEYEGIESNAEIKGGLFQVINILTSSSEHQEKVTSQLMQYRSSCGGFGLQVAVNARKVYAPAEWWISFGYSCPELQQFAIKILSLTCSASPCERNWSTFEMRQFLLEVLGGTPGEGDEFTVERLRGDEVNMDQMMLGLLEDDDLDDDNIYGGASMQEINAFPVSKFQDTGEPVEPCVLCLEIPSLGDHIRHLPCLHKFHKDCIDRWLCQKSFCPLCRFSIR